MRRLVVVLAVVIGSCGGGGETLSCDQLTVRLKADADRSFAEFDRTGNVPDESDEIKKLAVQFKDQDCPEP